MIQERYCSLEVSKLLREKGFDEPCRSYYLDKYDYREGTVSLTKRKLMDWNILRPTHQMAIDWLREIHKLHIEIYANASGYRFIISKPGGDGTDLVTDVEGPNNGNAWDDYGECFEAALEFCLTELI